MSTHVVRVPQMGVTAEEAIIVEWRVEVGSRVSAGQALVVVETEKSDIEVEAPVTGWLRSTAEVGAVLAIGAPMAVVTDTVDEQLAEQEVEGREEPLPAPSDDLVATGTPRGPVGPTPTGRAVASPAARRRAAELGVGLDAVTGTGPGGRILETDVQAAASMALGSPTTGLSAGRRAMARIMTASAGIPQLSVGRTVDMRSALTAVADWRHVEAAVSLTDILVAAFARSIAAHRRFAVRISGVEEIISVDSIDIALAIPAKDYLEAPALAAADSADPAALARERRRLIGSVASSTLSAGDRGKPCATLSNLGPQGVHRFQALVTPPQSCVLAVGAVRAEAVVVNNAIAIARCAELWLTADHRVVDGAHAAELLETTASLLEHAESAFGYAAPAGSGPT